MTILSDASVAFREKGAPRFRQLWIAGGDIVSSQELAAVENLAVGPPTRPWLERQRAFDAARYDRLRVLTTELVRVIADGGEVTIGLGGRILSGAAALRLLRAV
jgi:hypothetical protein